MGGRRRGGGGGDVVKFSFGISSFCKLLAQKIKTLFLDSLFTLSPVHSLLESSSLSFS